MPIARLVSLLFLVLGSMGGPAAAAVAPPAAIDVAGVPARDPAPNDASSYRRFVLPNGMQVLLLSDPKLNVASAAVVVGVGSLSDPPERPGLAHYLEHMLFLGTEKYPAVEEFGEYLQRNGGYNNAYTARDRTNYHLEIRPEAFEGALDRFAQFFIAPKFTPQYNEREVNAVNSEFQKNLEDDNWREFALRNSVYREGHPARSFNIGSTATLKGTTREELLAFHQRYYSANRMSLVLAAPAGLDQLETWARGYFGAVPNLQRPELRYAPDYLPPKAALRLLRMEPIKDLRRITLSFPLPDLRDAAGSKPAELVGFVLGNEGPGSLLAALKAEGLATGLSAGADADTPDYGSFDIAINLTPQGLAQTSRVLGMAFAAIDLLRREGVPRHLFEERRAMARLDERYRDKGEGASLALSLGNLVMDYPLAVAERVPFLWQREDPAAVRKVLDRLRPDNLLVTLVAKGVPVDRTERWFGTRYSYVEDSGPAWQALQNPPRVAALKLPAPNRFVPERTALLPLAPAKLIDDPALALYHLQDTEFQRPMQAHLLRLRLPRDVASLRTATLLRFYEACVKESLDETLYAGTEAGLRVALEASLDGVRVAVDGYDVSVARMLDALLPGLAECRITPERFAALQDRLVRELSAFERADAYLTLTESRRRAVREFYYRPDEMLPLARTVTLAQVRSFARTLFARGKLEMLSHGNLGPDDAVAVARKAARILRTAAVPEAQLLRRRLLAMAPGKSLLTSETLKVNNSAYRRELVLGGDTPELRAATLALASFIGPLVYNELRTQQQLGYIVFGGAGNEGRSHFAYFIVQSGDYPADEVAARADAVIAKLPEQLASLPAEAWQTIVGGVRSKLLEKDKSIGERAGRLFELTFEHDADWARRDATLAALERLTPQRAAAVLADAMAPATGRSRTFLGFSRDHQPKRAPAVTFTDAAAWKVRQRYE
ncbi:MAG TPA: insulinase family protein [Burkholderiaceae bacterium]|nr:insulinase family protein [Burkholderiaceae bacterium]